MKIFVNKNINRLFGQALLLIAAFFVLSAAAAAFDIPNAAACVSFLALCMAAAILTVMYLYFRRQNRIMEHAVRMIQGYREGDRSMRIPCDEEGELYRLFYEVNALVSMLDAHAEEEKKGKIFLKDVIADISHQLKTPLTALNVYNGLLLEKAQELPEIMEFAELSEQELDRIETLVQNLLKIARLDAGTVVLEKYEEHVADMMAHIERRFAYRAQKEGKRLELYGEDGIRLFCDRSWLLEAVGNLVKNALDHTREGDVIRIEWKQFASIVQIAVKDNGSGIHPEDLYHIFKRFYRSRFSQDTQGSGLGLPLAKAVVEAHGGTIEVDSQLGAGSSFLMNFLNPTEL